MFSFVALLEEVGVRLSPSLLIYSKYFSVMLKKKEFVVELRRSKNTTEIVQSTEY